MTRFKLALLVGFGLGWAVGTGRAQELLRRLRNSPDEQLTLGGSTAASPSIASEFGSQTAGTTTRVASA